MEQTKNNENMMNADVQKVYDTIYKHFADAVKTVENLEELTSESGLWYRDPSLSNSEDLVDWLIVNHHYLYEAGYLGLNELAQVLLIIPYYNDLERTYDTLNDWWFGYLDESEKYSDLEWDYDEEKEGMTFDVYFDMNPELIDEIDDVDEGVLYALSYARYIVFDNMDWENLRKH